VLSARATALATDPSVPLGSTESYPLPGVTTLIRVEPHAWSRDAQGNLVEGCFRSSSIYLPSGSSAIAGVTTAASDQGLNRTVNILTALSLAVGTAATIAAWKRGQQ
jgi:hypothetical protein